MGAIILCGGPVIRPREDSEFRPKLRQLETALPDRLCGRNQVSVYHHESYWQCMDTYREIQLLEAQCREHRAPRRIWNN